MRILSERSRGCARPREPGAWARPLRIGSFSAASNVTGILSDTDRIASLLHAHGALSLWDYAAKLFRRHRINIRTGCRVAEVTADSLRLADGEAIPAGVVLWCTGFAPSAFVASLPWAKDKAGRLLTDEYLQVFGRDGVYALGDCACPRGQSQPQLAQVAEQQGDYLARRLNRRVPPGAGRPFRWRNLGVSSYLGGQAAVAQTAHTGGWPSGWRTSSGGRPCSRSSSASRIRCWCR